MMAKLPGYMTLATQGHDPDGNLAVKVTIHRSHPAWWWQAAKLTLRHTPARRWLTVYRELVRL